MPKVKEVWIVKYCLSKGIFRLKVYRVEDDRVYVKGSWSSFKLGRDAFEHYNQAVAAATAMATKKVKTLEKQLAKMRELERNPKFVEER